MVCGFAEYSFSFFLAGHKFASWLLPERLTSESVPNFVGSNHQIKDLSKSF